MYRIRIVQFRLRLVGDQRISMRPIEQLVYWRRLLYHFSNASDTIQSGIYYVAIAENVNIFDQSDTYNTNQRKQ